MKRCLGCMEEYEEKYNVCPCCGFVEGTEAENPIHINPGNMLKGMNSNYTIGKVLGSGSFGVTYLAWDNVLERKVAIKEYMPSEYSTRSSGNTMVEVTEDKRELFSKGMGKFLEEARKLAKFEEDGIVRIFDHFYKNDTAYIVMEYLDGITLTEYLEQNGKMNPKMAVAMLMPIMISLEKVHNLGIIHRDIAPDNIMITRDGSIKLIDFGAARFTSSSSSKSLTVLVKPGYSPEEQYRRRGDQGTHTDVYSLAATLYKMITGETPKDALERRAELESRKKNILQPIRKYNRNISKVIENAIYNAMNIKIEDRTSTVRQLIEELTSEKPVKLKDQTIPLIDRLRWRPWQIITASASAIVVATLIVLLSTNVLHFDKLFKEEFEIPEGMTRVPALINKDYDTANKLIDEAKLVCVVKPKEYYNAIPKNKVYKQSLNTGLITDINNVVEIWVSDGPQMFDMPSVVGMMETAAVKELEDNSISYKLNYQYSMNAKGTVTKQSYEGGSKIAKGKVVQITVSKGVNPSHKIEEKIVEVPNLVNMDYQKAIETYGNEMQIIVEKRDWSDSYGDYEKDRIMVQNIKAGTKIKNTETAIKVIVSDGKEMYEVPDVVMRTEESAKAMLQEKYLKVNVEYKTHETFEKGMVISQSISAGKFVKPNTNITIVVSTGKNAIEMINVVGMEEAKAKKQITELGLNVQVTYEYSKSIASGNVISQSIKAGTNVVPGNMVLITVSSGEELYEVPNVVDDTVETAKSKLQKYFVVKIVEEYSDVQKGYVCSQSLVAGTKHKKNREILLVVSKGKQPYTVTFDSQGGEVSSKTITAYYNEMYGKLPTCTKEGYKFEGWYTASSGGSKITETNKYNVQGNSTLYAHWTDNKEKQSYTVTFDSQSGKVSNKTITAYYNEMYGKLPTCTKEGYKFEGWYTAPSGGSKITETSKYNMKKDSTLYAHWISNEWSGWTETKPSDGDIYEIQEKTQYRYRDKEYTQNTTSSTLSGWTYDASSSYYTNYGPWSAWQDTPVSSSNLREVGTQQVQVTAAYTVINLYYYRYYNAAAKKYYYSYGSGNSASEELHTAILKDTDVHIIGYYDGRAGYHWNGGWWFFEGEIWFESSREVRPATYKTQYRYRDRQFVYKFWRWDSWSSWSDTAVTETASRDVETRKLYNYILK